MRMGTPSDGPLGGYRNWTARPTLESFWALYYTFLAPHRFEENEVAVFGRGIDPMVSPAFRNMATATAQRDEARRQALEGGSNDAPRLAASEPLSKAYIEDLLVWPPEADVAEGKVRLCQYGVRCVARHLHASKGKIGRELLLCHEKSYGPEELRLRILTPRRCWLCELWWLHTMVQRNQAREQALLGRPINFFTVKVGKGEYDARIMLPEFHHLTGRPTGIVGHVPMMNVEWYAAFTYPPPTASLGGVSLWHTLSLVGGGSCRK